MLGRWWWNADTHTEAEFMPGRSASGYPYGVCPVYWCPFVESRVHASSYDRNESFTVCHVITMAFSVVITNILGRHRQHSPGPGTVVCGSLGSTLSLLHVCVVEASSAGMRALLTSCRRRLRDLDCWLMNVTRFLWASMLEGRLNHPRGYMICLVMADDGNFSA